MPYVPNDGDHDSGTVRQLVYTTGGTVAKPAAG